MSAEATDDGENRRYLIAYALPFAIFMVMTAVESTSIVLYPFVYVVKIALVCAALAVGRKLWPKFERKGLPLGVVVGAVGLPVWVFLSKIDLSAHLPASISDWLIGKRSGGVGLFDMQPPAFMYVMFAIRLFGLAVVVPVMEELFWRGFLMRFLIAEPFQKVAIGTYTRGSFVIVTVLFTLVHPEILAALVWGAAINLLLYRTKNLWACVAMHATTNALLGVYILKTGAWELW